MRERPEGGGQRVTVWLGVMEREGEGSGRGRERAAGEEVNTRHLVPILQLDVAGREVQIQGRFHPLDLFFPLRVQVKELRRVRQRLVVPRRGVFVHAAFEKLRPFVLVLHH